MKSRKRIWASGTGLFNFPAPSKPRGCPSLQNLCLWSLSKTFLSSLKNLNKEEKRKQGEELLKVIDRVAPRKGLKEKLFSEFVRQGCYEGPVLSTFSSSQGGFLDSLDLSGTQVSNEGLALVGSIKTLSILILQSCTTFDDGGISALAHGACVGRLRVLDLSKCKKVTDSGLFHLPSFTQLSTLALSNLMITDDGAIQLRSLMNLEYLSLARTKITDMTIETLSEDFLARKGRQGLASLKALKLNFVDLSSQSVLFLARFPSLELVEMFGCWPRQDIWEEFQLQLDQHRNGCVIVHRTTGKLLIGQPKVTKVEIEKRNSLKQLECAEWTQWNTRQLARLLNGSPPTSQNGPQWEASYSFPTPQVLETSKSVDSPHHEVLFHDSIEDPKVTFEPPTQSPPTTTAPRVTLNRLCLLPANHPAEQNNVLPEDIEKNTSSGKFGTRERLEREPPQTRKRRKTKGVDDFLSPFFGETTSYSPAGGERDEESLECAKFRSVAEWEGVERAQSFRALSLYCKYAEQLMKKKRKRKRSQGQEKKR